LFFPTKQEKKKQEKKTKLKSIRELKCEPEEENTKPLSMMARTQQ
jgi:hypothetical protein